MIAKSDLLQVRKDIEGFVGSKVRVKANKGRKRIVVKEGVLENTYPSIFVIRVQNEFEDTFRSVSYSYTDLLTHTVELSLCKEQ
ncbi:MAG: Veg protein [Epulopiscium sp.]|nr:Veg protein [Candidatus Epulonipiscium sp.]